MSPSGQVYKILLETRRKITRNPKETFKFQVDSAAYLRSLVLTILPSETTMINEIKRKPIVHEGEKETKVEETMETVNVRISNLRILSYKPPRASTFKKHATLPYRRNPDSERDNLRWKNSHTPSHAYLPSGISQVSGKPIRNARAGNGPSLSHLAPACLREEARGSARRWPAGSRGDSQRGADSRKEGERARVLKGD